MAENAVKTTVAPSPGSGLRLSWVTLPVVIFALLSILFLFALRSGDPSKLPSALIGKPAPQFALQPLEGLREDNGAVPGFDSTALALGHVSVVNFWASWCVPCVQEHPVLIELKRRTGVGIYGVNYKDQTDAARRFLGLYGNPFRAVGFDGNGRVAIDWGVYGMPETFVIDGSGRIVYKHVGPMTPEALESKVIPAIAAASKS